MSVAGGVAPAATARTRPGAGRLVASAAIGVLVLIVLGVGVALITSVPAAVATRDAYNAATPFRCGHLIPPPGIDCWQGTDGHLTAMSIEHTALGNRQAVATISTAAGVLQVHVEPAPAVACVAAGAPVVVRSSSGGAVTTIFTPAGNLATSANPNIDPDTAFDGGLTLVAIGLLIPAGIALARLRRRRGAGGPAVLEAYRPPYMRFAVLAFLLGQAADVVTSAIGQASGLSEGNSLVDVFVRTAGPLGFLVFRLPAIVLVLLGLTQVPRRIAAVTLVGVGAIFVSVGVHNAVLAAGTVAAAACGAGPLR